MKKSISLQNLFVCALIVTAYATPVLGQEILVTYRNGINGPTNVGILNPSECAFSVVDTSIASGIDAPFFSYTPSGQLYALSLQSGDFYSVNLNDGSLSYIGSFNTNFGEIQFVNDSIFYAIRLEGMIGAVGIANVNTGETEILTTTETDPVGYGFGLTIRNDSLYYGDGFGIHYMDRENFQNSEMVIPLDIFEEGAIDDMVTLQLSCDSTITYGFRWAPIEERYFMDIIDFENQQRIDIGCELPYRIRSAASPLELTPPACTLVVDPDLDDSTAPLLSYAADTACAPGALPVVDADAGIESELGYVDSIRVLLDGTLDGAAESLSFLGQDSIQVSGGGSALLLSAPLRPSIQAWELALQALRYSNTAMPLQAGERQVRFIAYAANNVSDTAHARLPLFSSTPSAGEDASVTACPGAAPFQLLDSLAGSPAPGGQWQPGSGSFDPATDAPGTYLYIQSSAGCPSDTAVATVEIADAPAFSLGVDTVLCPGGSLLLQAPAGLQNYSWSDGSSGASLLAQGPGSFWLQAANSAGCAAADTIELAFSDLSGVSLQPSPALCRGGSSGSILAAPQGGLPPYSYNWTGGIAGNPLSGMPAGTYSLTVTDAAGCTQAATAEITEPAEPVLFQESLQLCSGDTFTWQGAAYTADTLLTALYTTAEGCDSAYQLQLVFTGTILIEEEATACEGEPYSWQGQLLSQDTTACITYASSSGCDSTRCLTLAVLPAPDAGLPDSLLLCGGSTAVLQAGPAAGYTWLDGSQGNSIEVGSPGLYSVTLTGDNGCVGNGSTEVLLVPPLSAAFSLLPPGCTGEENGEITIADLEGGSPPYQYELSGSAPQSSPVFAGLPAGSYELGISGSNGCRLDTVLVLPGPVPVTAEAGPSRTIVPGEAAPLLGSTNLLVPIVQWSPPEGLSCTDCLTPQASPAQTQLYQLQVTDSLGCTASDEVLVTVEERQGFAMPNAFSPNGDGRNDALGPVFAMQELRVRRFMVFNRWGAMLHERENLPIDDPGLPWDGTFKGQAAPVEVYAYYIEVEWPDGRVQQDQGEVSLLR
ncbi:gliding motility-associated C-terminal domain-containing protein [Phaeodactylibacter xiamenensis]|uniref:T9SS type B sorting domain-containing protein n=1 Tax=Phaeodactylibacter xiamenensis TaxID=1524460 RepID=UPI003CCB827B